MQILSTITPNINITPPRSKYRGDTRSRDSLECRPTDIRIIKDELDLGHPHLPSIPSRTSPLDPERPATALDPSRPSSRAQSHGSLTIRVDLEYILRLFFLLLPVVLFPLIPIGLAESSAEQRMEEPGLDEDDPVESVRDLPLPDDQVDVCACTREEGVVQVFSERVGWGRRGRGRGRGRHRRYNRGVRHKRCCRW